MLLRRNDTQAALETLAKTCIDYWKSPAFRKDNPGPEFDWHGDPTKIKEYVKVFTEGVMLTPPAILVDPYLKECYAAHAKFVDYDGNFEIFRTRTCFRFKVPIEVIIDPFSLWWVQNEELQAD